MDEKKLAIILGTAGILLILLVLMLMPGKRRLEPSQQSAEQLLAKKGQKVKNQPSGANNGSDSGGSSGSAGNSVSGAKPGSGSELSITTNASATKPIVTAGSELDHQAFTDDEARAFRQNRENAKNRIKGNDSAGSNSNDNRVTGSVNTSAASQQSFTKIISGARTGGSSSAGGSSGSSGQVAERKNTGDSITFGRSGISVGSAVGDTEMMRQTFSEEEVKEFREKREAIRLRIAEQKMGWAAGMASNGGLTDKTRAKYRLKLIEGFAAGNEAFNSNNYGDAIKFYMSGVKDPDADPVTKYSCFENMSMAARMLKDYDLYLEILKEQGKLIAEEDLTVLGIKEKDSSGLEFYEERRRFVQAIKDPSPANIQKLVEEIMKKDKLDEKERESTEKQFIDDVAEWKSFFERAA